uniref:Uncharacterized protein n=1 Tax=Anguilla anguilla TaxID=7936 RepID=A0A0E9TQD8_ANGAN
MAVDQTPACVEGGTCIAPKSQPP